MSEYEKAQKVKQMVKELLEFAQQGEVDLFMNAIKRYVRDHDEAGDTITPSTVISGTRDGNGRTALHFAAIADQINIVSVIMETCPDVLNVQDQEGLTALALALITGHLAVAECLVDAGADVNIADNKGVCCIHRAAAHGDTEGVALLCGAGANLELQSGAGTPLHWAAGEAQLATVRQLVGFGASCDALNSQKATPLVMAAARGAEEVCEALISAGADVSICLPGGLTCLHVLAELGLAGAVALALKSEKGRQCASALDDQGRTPLDLAVLGGHESCIYLLYEFTSNAQDSGVEHVLQKISQEAGRDAQGETNDSNSKTSQERARSDSGTTRKLESTSAALCPEDVEEALRLKTEGNAFLQQRNFMAAVDKYTAAICKDGSNAALWSNRSAAYMELQQYENALADAEICRRLKPDWPKACYRTAVARLALHMYEEGAVSAWEGVQLDPANQELKSLLCKCVKIGRKVHLEEQKKATA